MIIFLYFAFFFAGAVVGGSIGDGPGAFIGGAAGLLAFRSIHGANRKSAPTRTSDETDGALTLSDLQHEVQALRRQVDALSARVAALAGDSGSAVAAEPVPADVEAHDPAQLAPAPVAVAPAATMVTATADDETPGTPATAAPASLPETRTAMPQIAIDAAAPIDIAPAGPPAWFTAARQWLFGGNALVRVGVVVLFFGLAFLLKFAAEHAVLPLEVRYLAAGLGALTALGLGWRLRSRRPDYALTLQGLGVASLYLLTFAAFRLHDLLPGSLASLILIGTCGLSAALAILQNARILAIVGICGGFLAPVLTSTGGGSHVALFSYYALLNAGIVAIAWFKAWRPLNVLGFVFTFGIGSLWGSRNYRDDMFATTEPFLLLFFAFYLVVALLYARRRQQEPAAHAIEVAGERIDYVDGTLVFGNPLLAFGLQYLMVRDMALGSALSALALGFVYLPLALLLQRRSTEASRLLVESFLALGVIFASLAIPLGLDAQWTSAAWAVEGAGIFWVGLRQGRPAAQGFALLLQAGSVASLVLALDAPGTTPGLFGPTPMLAGAWLGPLLAGAALLVSGRWIRAAGFVASSWQLAIEPLLTVAGFVVLALTLPLLLDQSWTGLGLAVYGAMLVGWSRRSGHVATLALAPLLQLAGGALFGMSVPWHPAAPLLNLFWLGSLAVAGAGCFSAWACRHDTGPVRALSLLCLVWALLWWLGAGHSEIDHHMAHAHHIAAVLGLAALTGALLLGAARLGDWPDAGRAALLLVPGLILLALAAADAKAHPAADGGWLAWPVALAVMWLALRRVDDHLRKGFVEAAHVAAVLLTTALAAWQGEWLTAQAGAAGSAWPVLGGAVAPALVLLALAGRRFADRWPLAAFPGAYALAAAIVALWLWLRCVVLNGGSDGNAAPLPFLPLANPTDLAGALSLLALLRWCEAAAADRRRLLRLLLAGSTFYWLNGLLLRTLHHWADVPFNVEAMAASTLVQASLSLFWSVLALALMLLATRRGWRPLWLTGGGLLAGVVAKLFIVDLASVGTIERIVSFIGVGILLLVVGYFSPVPPKRAEPA